MSDFETKLAGLSSDRHRTVYAWHRIEKHLIQQPDLLLADWTSIVLLRNRCLTRT